MDILKDKLAHIKNHFGMYFYKKRFELLITYLCGMDDLSNWSLLKEFRNFLVIKLKMPSNFHISRGIEYLYLKGDLSELDTLENKQDELFDFFLFYGTNI